MNILKKMGTASVYGKITREALSKIAPNPLPLYTLAGVVRGIKVVSTNMGDAVGLIGEFIATNAKGEQFSSAVCYPPGVVAQAIQGAFTQGTALEFAFNILAQPDAPDAARPSVLGYQYIAQPLVELKPTDAMTRLMNLVANQQAAKAAAPATDNGKTAAKPAKGK